MNKIIIITTVFLFAGISTKAQKNIDMETAATLVITEHPSIKQQDLYIEQQMLLKEGGKQQPFMSAGYSFEEAGIIGTGIHSIFIQQSFNMPGIAKSKGLMREEMAKSGKLQKLATQKQLKRYISGLYQQILYRKNLSRLNEEMLMLYNNIEKIAKKRNEVGETGELPVLATQTVKQQLELEQMGNQQDFLTGMEKLKQFLGDSSLTDIRDSLLVSLSMQNQAIQTEKHPVIQKTEQDIAVNKAREKVIESQLLPQVNIGFQTQVVQGNYPFFAGQLGFSVPLFRKGIKAQVNANRLNSKILEENKGWQTAQLKAQKKISDKKRQQLELQTEHIDKKIIPTLQKQQEYSQRAFEAGELGYLNVLQNVKQIIDVKRQRLELIYRLNLVMIDYEYLY